MVVSKIMISISTKGMLLISEQRILKIKITIDSGIIKELKMIELILEYWMGTEKNMNTQKNLECKSKLNIKK